MATTRARRSHHRREVHPLAAVLGAHVRRLRELRGFSFDAFAEELGRGYVSDLERGKVVPTFVMLAKLATILELDLVDIVAVGTSPRDALIEAIRGLPIAQVQRLVRVAREMAAESRAKEEVPLVLNPSTRRRKRPV